MLAIAVSLLFGLATLAALAVIHTGLLVGARRARAIFAELAEIDSRVTRSQRVPAQPRAIRLPALAAA